MINVNWKASNLFLPIICVILSDSINEELVCYLLQFFLYVSRLERRQVLLLCIDYISSPYFHPNYNMSSILLDEPEIIISKELSKLQETPFRRGLQLLTA